MFEGFPHVISATASGIEQLADFWRVRRDEIDQQLLTHGAIVFKGYRVDTAAQFGQFMNGLSLELGNYVDGNSPRTKLTDAVYTSTEYPAELPISLHNELSYSDAWPARLYFCCVTAANTGGSTTIADSRRVHATMPVRIAEEFERKGVMYVRNLQGEGSMGVGKTWQQTFETDDRGVVEAHCRARNIRYEWRDDAMLRLIQVRPRVCGASAVRRARLVQSGRPVPSVDESAGNLRSVDGVVWRHAVRHAAIQLLRRRQPNVGRATRRSPRGDRRAAGRTRAGKPAT